MDLYAYSDYNGKKNFVLQSDCNQSAQAQEECAPHRWAADQRHDLPIPFPAHLQGARLPARPSDGAEGSHDICNEGGGGDRNPWSGWGRDWHANGISARHHWKYRSNQVSCTDHILKMRCLVVPSTVATWDYFRTKCIFTRFLEILCWHWKQKFLKLSGHCRNLRKIFRNISIELLPA